MRRLYLLLAGVLAGICGFAQNPATTITLSSRNINLPCGTSCFSVSAQVPHIKQTTNYVVTTPAYQPYPYTTPTGNVVSQIYVDDTWSPVIAIPFNFCYYGNVFTSLLMGSNSAITFDISRANTGSGYSISSTTGAIPNTAYAPNMIFGPYHDIDPSLSSVNKKIEWRVEGTAPKRRFIASYNDMPYFGSSCTSLRATHLMVLYEGTGIVEVYIKDKPFCTGWNSGLTILGLQNQARNSAVAAPGKNATQWGTAGMDSCYRFIPSDGASRFKSARLLVNGTPVATGDTSTLSPGVLNLNFQNVCPTADSTAYVLEVTFADCTGNPPQDIIFTDTVFVKKITPVVTVAKTDPTCAPDGSIIITAAGGTPPYQYSINGGTSFQPGNSFTALSGGTYNIVVRDNLGCTITQTVTLAVVNTLAQTVATTNANCTTGGSISITATGGTAPYQYSVNGGTSFQSSNVFTGLTAGNYTVVTSSNGGLCTVSQSVTVNFTNNLTLAVGNGGSICRGQSFTPNVSGNATAFTWSPATGVSNTAVANPVLSPNVTTAYNVTATLGTCTTQGVVNVNVFAGATANAGPDVTILGGDNHLMQASASPGSYLWSPASGLSSAAVLNPVATPATTTTYTLRVTSPDGCIASDDMTVTVIPYCIKVMEAFTPNGDGINDRWLVTNGNCLISCTAQVFNRYGSRVFESNDYRNTWEGNYQGKPLPDGTYYYVISFRLINGKQQVLKGNLTILR